MRAARTIALVTVTRAGHHGLKGISSFCVGPRTAPAEKARIGVVEARVQRMAKNAISVRLPDFDDGIQDRPIPFLQHAAGQQNMLSPRLLSLKAGQVLAAGDKIAGKERADRTVGEGII